VLSELYLSASTIEKAPWRERLAAAQAGGFDGIGLRPTHWKAARADGLTDIDLKAMLADAGLELIEIGFVADWWDGGEAGCRARDYEQTLYRLKDKLGGRHMMMISGPLDDPLEVLAERFAAVCDRAAEHGLRVALEFLPWTATRDAATAWRIVQLAGRANGGLALDIWHHRRGGNDDEVVRAIDPAHVVTVQLSDGDFAVVESDLDDTFRRRRLAGHGEFRVADFVRLLEHMGVSAPAGVEVLSDEMRQLPVDDFTRRAADATRAVIAQARRDPAAATPH
jgi:sugar phosphate isomerase/epimerase